MAPVALKDLKGPQDVEVLLDLLVRRVMMAFWGKLALQDPVAFQVTRGLLEILVHLVPEETRDKMGYLGLQERKEPWELLDLDPVAQKERKVHLDLLERRALQVHVGLLVPLVQGDIQVALASLDSLVLSAILDWRGSALQD